MISLPPKCWHIYVVDLAPRIGSKPGKTRPCLSVQPDTATGGGLTSSVVIPLTTRLPDRDAYPLRVRLHKGICGLEKDSDLMIDQILAWDHSLFRRDLGLLPDILQRKVKQAIRDLLELDLPDDVTTVTRQ